MAVYFIQAGEGGPVKIGAAADVQHRLRALQCGHYLPLTILRTVQGGFAVEAWLHRHYRARHIRGEWFRHCATMATVDPRAEVIQINGRDPFDPALSAPVDAACQAVGGADALADKLGVARSAISNWKRSRIPANRVGNVAALTGLPPHALRPDLFPAPDCVASA